MYFEGINFQHKLSHFSLITLEIYALYGSSKLFSCVLGSPPPPPRPARGIIKNRLTKSGIKKVKKTRVNWPSGELSSACTNNY